MKKVELKELKSLNMGVKNFLGIIKARNYEELVKDVLTAFKNLGCRTFTRMH